MNTRTLAAIGIGAFLYGSTSWIGIPIAPDTELRPAIALLALIGAIFGPMVGIFAGFIGHAIHDLIIGGEIYWAWALASGITAAFMGCTHLDKEFNPQEGMIKMRHLFQLTVFGIIGIFVSLAFSGWFDVQIMNERNEEAMVQVLSAGVANTVVFFILGLPAVWAYAKRDRRAVYWPHDR